MIFQLEDPRRPRQCVTTDTPISYAESYNRIVTVERLIVVISYVVPLLIRLTAYADESVAQIACGSMEEAGSVQLGGDYAAAYEEFKSLAGHTPFLRGHSFENCQRLRRRR